MPRATKKKTKGEPVSRMAAFKIPEDTLIQLKAYALATGKSQAEVVAQALRTHLNKAIPASGKAKVIADLVQTYSKT